MNRRKFLTILGGGVVLAAGAGAWRVSRSPDKARAPWHKAGTAYQEPRRKALSYALLAPNPHNRQPWMIDLATPDEVTLYVDNDRLLPHTDPFSRQITIGQGCFLELMVMAAAQDGYRIDLTLFPEGSNPKALDKRPIANARFVKDETVQPDPLFAHVHNRRSQKEPYDLSQPVDAETLGQIINGARSPHVDGSVEQTIISRLRKLTEEALLIELDTPHTYKESVDLFRIGADEINTNPDGIDFSGPLFETLHTTGLFTRKSALDRNSSIYKSAIDAVLKSTRTGMGYLWLTTPSNSREDQINAGRDWVRINLATTAAGIALQPLSQALQEYTEMAEHYANIHKMLAPAGHTIQMLGRIGYATDVPPSPRWPLEAKLMEA